MAFISKLIPADKLGDFIATVRKQYTADLAADTVDREAGKLDARFVAGDQWEEAVKAERTQNRLPSLVENRLHVFVGQVVNDGRQSKPSIAISAMDGGKPETAEMWQARIRQIEYDSNADVAWDTMREQQVISGRGSARITTEYEGPHSFKQVIRIKPIQNQFSVIWDSASKEYDRSDADHCFVISVMGRDAYERKYGKDTALGLNGFKVDEEWVLAGDLEERIVVAEYWRKEWKKRKLVQLASGDVKWEDELPKDGTEVPVQSREVEDWQVQQFVIDGTGILDETEWVGSWIPILQSWGREEIVDGQVRHVSLVRHAKDPQKMVNLYWSNIAHQISMLSKSPYIGEEGAFEGHEDEWRQITSKAQAYIQYKGRREDLSPINRPARDIAEPPIAALVEGYNQAVDAIKASMGIFDASLGAKSNEQSGIAIQRRAKEADNANFHFHDNEARTRRHAGRIILELEAKISKDARSWMVMDEDGTSRVVKLGQPHVDEKTGKEVVHDVDSRFYGVAVTTGPSYTSQRAESFDKMTQMAQAWPQFLQFCGDIMLRQSDMPGAEECAERLKKMLPPELQDAPKGQQDIPPQVKAAMDQGKQIMTQLSQKVHELQDELDAKKPELASRERIAAMQEETKRLQIEKDAQVAMAQMGVTSAIAQLKEEMAAIKHSIEMDDAQQARAEAAEQAQQQPAEQQTEEEQPEPVAAG